MKNTSNNITNNNRKNPYALKIQLESAFDNLQVFINEKKNK
jgi:hypothetical protein